MILRKGTDKDVEEIAALWLEMVKELDPSLTPNRDWWEKHAHIFMQSPTYTMLVVEEDKRIVGFLDFFMFPEPATSKIHAVFQHFYVIPIYRNRYYSSALYREGLKSAKENGAKTIEFCCFPKEVSFWEKHGCSLKRNFMRREVV